MRIPTPYFRLMVMFSFIILPLLFLLLGQTKWGGSSAAASPPQTNPLGQTYVPASVIPLPYDYSHVWAIQYDAPRQRLYLASMGDLLSINLINKVVTTVNSIPAAAFVGDLALQEDGEILYVMNTQSAYQRIYRLDPDNWNMLNNYTVPETDSMELVNGRVFLTNTYDNKLLVLDATTGAIQQTLQPGGGDTVTGPVASPDGNLLFTHGSNTIQKFDISTTPVTLTLNIPVESGIDDMTVAQDGSYLLVSRYPAYSLTRYHTDDFSLIDAIPSQSGVSLRDIATGDGMFYGVYAINGTKPLLRVFDDDTGQEIRTFGRAQEGQQYFNKIAVMGDGHVAMHTSGTLAGNELYVLSPADHGIAIPIVYNEYCAGPYLDDFSNPNSGWPVGTSGTITYRYINGEYSILHAQANRWTGVTLGHMLDVAYLAEIDTRIVNYQDGIVGLIYGLNSDWTDFYTFEIWPREQLWVNYHYTAVSGWQLIQYGQSSSINTQAHNQLQVYRSAGSPHLSFGINYSSLYFPPYVPGRFGFSAAAFENNMDFRYDDYKYVVQGCEQYAAQPELISVSPATLPSRPPITDLLNLEP